MQMLTVENVSKQKDGADIISNISLGVESGEILGLLGPGGAGKTTLIKIIAGLCMPTAGNVYIGKVNLYGDFEKCMRFTGVVLDEPNLYADKTGMTNLRAAAAMRGGIPKERIDRVVEMLELGYIIDRKVKTYSRGEAKMLGFAQAILHQPRLLLLDEATDGLDPVEFMTVRRIIQSMAQETGTAVLMTAHRMEDIERTCRSVAIMEEGVMIGSSTIERLRKFGTGKICQRMMVDRPADAARHIFDTMGIYSEVRNDYVVFDCDQSQVPKITAMLFSAGYMVYEFRPHEIALEEAYMRLLKERPSYD